MSSNTAVGDQANPPIRVLIHGASGRMGQALLRLLPEFPSLQLVATPGRGELPSSPDFDVAVDFSLPEALPALLARCREQGAALVTGTTGLDDSARQALASLAEHVPVLSASNFSLGVAVMDRLVEEASAVLTPAGWQCDIVEQHHIHKKDAPSGTALTLGASAARAGADVRYAALRAGDIVGEHTVQFAGNGERIELIHRATNRDIFARGALWCATRVAVAPAGMHTIRSLLFPA